jgi:hypothetical protein
LINALGNQPKVLVDASSPARAHAGDPALAWRWLGWFSLVLALAGLGDWVLAWIPMRLGSPEWEFGTIASTFAGLPLITMGFAGLLGSAIARGVRWQIIIVSIVVLLFATWILAGSILFLLDIPLALRTVQGIARMGLMKAIAKTALLGSLFLVLYSVGGIAGLRVARRLRSR